MPELPEVETVVRGLRPVLERRKLVRVAILDPRLPLPNSTNWAEDQLQGRTVTAVERRGKYMLWRLSGDLVAVHHLRMSGSYCVLGKRETLPRKHIRALYTTSQGTAAFRDPRRFGTLEIYTEHEAAELLNAKLGPEPLSEEFTASELRNRLRKRQAAIKAALLDQKVVAGLGNIYVDEALHAAGIDPRKSAGSVGSKKLDALVVEIRKILQEAIDRQGSSLKDHATVEGIAGTMQDNFLVYGRAGEHCFKCGRQLRSDRIGGRTTVFCTFCQR